MSTTSKSPRKVALVAPGVGKEALPAYCHRFSPKVYTQPQLFACLALKEFFKRLMSQRLHLTCYGRRWQVETTVSMIKRRLGCAVNARSYASQCRALMLKAIAHNILILYAPSEPSCLAA